MAEKKPNETKKQNARKGIDQFPMEKRIKETNHSNTTINNSTNCERVDKLRLLIQEVLSDVLKRDFYGNVNVRFAVQDGIIQSIQYCMEKTVK